jgi:2,5-diketo-D-gluconate reductase B
MVVRIPIAYGTYRMSGTTEKEKKDNISLIKYAISCGYRIFDTAESYGKDGDGYSENILGQAISESLIENPEQKRSDFIIISKVSPNNLNYNSVMSSAEKSAERLKTYIDYYLIHIPNEKITLDETFKAMVELKSKKLIKNYGVSNFSLDKLNKSFSQGITAVEEEFSLVYRYNLSQLRFCKENKLLFFSYMPLSNKGLLSVRNKPFFSEFVKKYQKTESQIALKWVMQCGAIPIVGSKDKSHIKENIDLNFTIDKVDMLKLANKKWFVEN